MSTIDLIETWLKESKLDKHYKLYQSDIHINNYMVFCNLNHTASMRLVRIDNIGAYVWTFTRSGPNKSYIEYVDPEFFEKLAKLLYDSCIDQRVKV